MFTGIVTAVGTVRRVRAIPDGGIDLEIRAAYRGVARGESIAVNGACLTVARTGTGWFAVRAVRTTLERTLLGTLDPGDRVNLERALRVGDRMGGHLVQGHVDGVAIVVRRTTRGDALLLDLALPDAVAAVTIPLGSVTVDGVSLTVNAMPGPGIIQVSLVPYTRDHTTLGALTRGSRCQVEGDVIGKFVHSLLPRPARRRKTRRSA